MASARLGLLLRAALLKRKERLAAIADHFFDVLVADDNRWSELARFREITLRALTPAELFTHIKTHMTRASSGSEKELFLYEAAFVMAFSTESAEEADEMFGDLFTRGDDRADLRAIRDTSVSCKIPSSYLDRPARDSTELTLEELRNGFGNELEAIRNGSRLGRLTWAAKVYFGLFSDSDKKASPNERLIAVLGEGYANVAIAGFTAAMSRPDVPSLADVVGMAIKHQGYDWWYSLMAGLVEGWKSNASLAAFSDDFLKAMLVFDLTNPVFERKDVAERLIAPSWKKGLTRGQPELVRDAYVAVARAKLANGDQIVDGLRELMVEDAFAPFRGDTALQLLRDFPNADGYRLAELFDGVVATPVAHSMFLVLAECSGLVRRQ